MKRGLFIVFEGCDRSGKSTQCRRLVQELNDNLKNETIAMRFPDRTTRIGQSIDEYLRCKSQVEDHAIHLLFSANRWELVGQIKDDLLSGKNVVVDRYAFSGVAFSAAKEGMEVEWCKNPDRGLPRPDVVCFLNVSAEEAALRGGYGQERYEKQCFQDKVKEIYKKLKDDSWKVIDTDRKTEDEVFKEILDIVLKELERHSRPSLEPLWKTEVVAKNGIVSSSNITSEK